MSAQQVVEISAKMYQCRDQAVFLNGEDGFIEAVRKWTPVFVEVMEKKSCSEIQALIELLERAKGKPNEGLLMHILTAVGCELAEPKFTLEK